MVSPWAIEGDGRRATLAEAHWCAAEPVRIPALCDSGVAGRGESLLAPGTQAWMRSETAQQQPARKLLAERGRAEQLHVAELDLAAQIANAAPGFDEQAQVGAHLQVHFVAGRLEAHVRVAALVHEPELSSIGRRVAELELDDGAAGRHARAVDVPMHAPGEECDIEIVLVHVTAPALSPHCQRIDDRSQLLARGSQRAAARQAFSCRAALHQSGALELTETTRQERGRNARHAAVDLVELRAAVDEPADDEQRPALAQQLDSERERTILTVLMCHDSIVLAARGRNQYKTASSGASGSGARLLPPEVNMQGDCDDEDGARVRPAPAGRCLVGGSAG